MEKLIVVNFESKRNPLVGLIEEQNSYYKKKEQQKLEPLEINFLHPVPGYPRKSELCNSLDQARPAKNGDHHPPVCCPDIVGNHIEQSDDNRYDRQEKDEFIILGKSEHLLDPLWVRD